MIASTTLLNRIGAELAQDPDVHAITDVTGFGLLGHALEMARGSGCALVIRDRDVPLFADAASLAQRRLRHRRVAAQLGELWRCRDPASGHAGVAAPSAYRSADFGRIADRLRSAAGPRRWSRRLSPTVTRQPV